jgi:hypothetical protein
MPSPISSATPVRPVMPVRRAPVAQPAPSVTKDTRVAIKASAASEPAEKATEPGFFRRHAGVVLPGVAAGTGLGLALGYGAGLVGSFVFAAPLALYVIGGGLIGAVAGGALASGAATVLPSKPQSPPAEGFWSEHKTAIATGAAGGGALGGGLGYVAGALSSIFFSAPVAAYVGIGLLVGAVAGGVLGAGGSAVVKK